MNYITQPFFLLECKFEDPTRVRVSSMSTKSSTSHSYQTLRSSVCRQRLTCSSLLSGNWIGSLIRLAASGSCEGTTLTGKNIGNQLIMSLLLRSIVSGLVLSSTTACSSSLSSSRTVEA